MSKKEKKLVYLAANSKVLKKMLSAALDKEGYDSILEWNEGNHFKDFDIRTAKAFAWVMEH